MLKYIIALRFIVFGDSYFLFECWKAEVIRRDKMQWRRLWRERGRDAGRGALFWWRLASEMYKKGGSIQQSAAKKINAKYARRYSHDISIRARMGKGAKLFHPIGVVITHTAAMGDRVSIRQNTTIGVSLDDEKGGYLWIGDDVDIGAQSTILGVKTHIGNNVKIGAMSFIHNATIPANCTYITEKKSRVVLHETAE